MTFIAGIRPILLGWVALMAARFVAALLIPEGSAASPGASVGSLASDLLIVAVLWYVGVRSGWRRLRLGAALFVIPFGLHFINTVEAVFFLTESGIQGPRSALNALLTYGLVAPVWVLLFAKGPDSAPTKLLPFAPRSPLGWVWRAVVSDFAYLLFYLIAGMIVFPFVQEFYATRVLPSLTTIIGLQLLLRGPVFIGICLLLLRMTHLEGWKAAVAVGAAFTLLSGIAPLLAPNPYLPDAVRWAHFFEVSISNFLFGAFVGWIWSRRKPVPVLRHQEAV